MPHRKQLGLPNIFGGPGLFSGQNLRDFTANQANNTGGPGLFSGQNLRDFTANQANNTSAQARVHPLLRDILESHHRLDNSSNCAVCFQILYILEHKTTYTKK